MGCQLSLLCSRNEVLTGRDNAAVERNCDGVLGAQSGISTIKFNDNAGWSRGRWCVGCGTSDGDDCLGRSSNPGVGRAFDESGSVVNSLQSTLCLNIDVVGRDA